MLQEARNQIDRFARRAAHVVDIHQKLVQALRGKPFVYASIETATLVIGERDQLIVDLASWTKGICQGGGLLRALQAESGAFAMPFRTSISWKKENALWRLGFYQRAFPKAHDAWRCKPSSADFDHLVSVVDQAFAAVERDRNEHRAHKFQQVETTAEALTPYDVVPILRRCWDFVEALSVLETNSSFAPPRFDESPDEDAAEDVVFGMLFRSERVLQDIYFKRAAPDGTLAARRQAFLERVHALDDDARRKEPDRAFNEVDLGKL